MSILRLKPATLRNKSDLVLHLQAALRDIVFLAFLLAWYSGGEVGLLRDRDLKTVAFFIAWLAPAQQPELNPSKGQRPTSLACPLNHEHMVRQLDFDNQIKWVVKRLHQSLNWLIK